MYYPCSENKDADQLRGYREADLRLCFRICKMPVFSRRGSFDSDLIDVKTGNAHYLIIYRQIKKSIETHNDFVRAEVLLMHCESASRRFLRFFLFFFQIEFVRVEVAARFPVLDAVYLIFVNCWHV